MNPLALPPNQVAEEDALNEDNPTAEDPFNAGNPIAEHAAGTTATNTETNLEYRPLEQV